MGTPLSSPSITSASVTVPPAAGLYLFLLNGVTGTGDIIVTVGGSPTSLLLVADDVTGLATYPNFDTALSFGSGTASNPAQAGSGATANAPTLALEAFMLYAPVGSIVWSAGITAGQQASLTFGGTLIVLAEGYEPFAAAGGTISPSLPGVVSANWGGIGSTWF
jgi:hypothetical protein